MRVAISEPTVLRLGKLWDFFKISIPIFFLLGIFAFGIILLNSSIKSENAEYRTRCSQLGGYLVKTEERSMLLCIREVGSKEKINVST